MMELGIPADRIGARKYGYPHRAFWPEETTGGGNVAGRQLTVDWGVFDAELTVNRPEAGAVWAKSRLRDRIDAVIAHEDAESLTGDHNFAEAMAPNTTLPITDGARHILRVIRGKPGSVDVIHYLTVGHLAPETRREVRGRRDKAARRDNGTPRARRVSGNQGRAQRWVRGPAMARPRAGGYERSIRPRLHELTGCLIADRRNGRLIEPAALSGKKRTAA